MLGLALPLSLGSQQVFSTVVGSTTTWNPAFNTNFTYSNGNKTAALTSGIGTDNSVKAVLGKTTAGSFTIVVTSVLSFAKVGIADSSVTSGEWTGSGNSVGYDPSGGAIYLNGGAVQSGLATAALGDAINVSYDGAGHVQFQVNGTNVGTSVDASAFFSGAVYPMASGKASNNTFTLDATGWG